MLKVLAQFFIFVFMFALMSISLFAQQPVAAPNPQDEDKIEELTQEILTAAAKTRGQQEATVELLAKTEKEAADDLKKTTEAKEKASRDFVSAKQKVEFANAVIKLGGGEKAIMSMGGYEKYEKLIRHEAEAGEKVSQLETQERSEREKLQTVQGEMNAAKQELTQMEAAQGQQRLTLVKFYGEYRNNKSDVNFKALTSTLTQMAAPLSPPVATEFISQDASSNQTEGARIHFETELDRKNNVQPIKATACTTVKPPNSPNCKEQLPKGWHYIWTVRNGVVTSDKNFYPHIPSAQKTITVVENR